MAEVEVAVEEVVSEVEVEVTVEEVESEEDEVDSEVVEVESIGAASAMLSEEIAASTRESLAKASMIKCNDGKE